MRILKIIIALVIIFPRFACAENELLDGVRAFGGAALSAARNSPLGTLKTQVTTAGSSALNVIQNYSAVASLTTAGSSALGAIRNSPLGPSLGVVKSAIILDRTGFDQNSINLHQQLNSGLGQLKQRVVSAVPSQIVDTALPITQDVSHGVLKTGIEICGDDFYPVPREVKTIWLGTSVDVYGSEFLRFDQRTEGMAFVGKTQRNTSDQVVKDFIVTRVSNNPGLVNDKNRQIWNDNLVLVMEQGNTPILRSAVATIFNKIPGDHKPANDMVVVGIQDMKGIKVPGAYQSGSPLIPLSRSTLIMLNRDEENNSDEEKRVFVANERVVAHEFGHFYADNNPIGKIALSQMMLLRGISKSNESFARDYGGTDVDEDFATMYEGWMVGSNDLLFKGAYVNNINNDPSMLGRVALMQNVFSEKIDNSSFVHVYSTQNGTISHEGADRLNIGEVIRLSANTTPVNIANPNSSLALSNSAGGRPISSPKTMRADIP